MKEYYVELHVCLSVEAENFDEAEKEAELANYDLGISIDNSENQNETSENGKIRKIYTYTKAYFLVEYHRK